MPSVFTSPYQQYQDDQVSDQISQNRAQTADLTAYKAQAQFDNAAQGTALDLMSAKINLLNKISLN